MNVDSHTGVPQEGDGNYADSEPPNANATIAQNCHIEPYAHLAPGVNLAHDVHIGTGAFLGIGAVVLPNVRIGAWTVVGAGAAVTLDLPERSVAVGCPARVIRTLQEKTSFTAADYT